MAIKTLDMLGFHGFYESIHSYNIDDALENMFRDDDGEDCTPEGFADCINYSMVFAYYSARYVQMIQRELAEAGIDCPSLEFKALHSPREYNFTTDTIEATIDNSDLVKLFTYCNESDLADVIKERFTSRDGFHSFYSNDLEDWKARGPNSWDNIELGTLLDAVIRGHCDLPEEIEHKALDWNCNGDVEEFICKSLNNKGLELLNS